MSNPAQGYYPPPPARKGLSPVVWILIAIGGFMVVAGVAVVATGLYFVKKVAENPIFGHASTPVSLAQSSGRGSP